MKVIGPEGCVAFRTFSLAGVVARFDALEAKHVETLHEHGVFLPRVTTWTRQLSLPREEKYQGHGTIAL